MPWSWPAGKKAVVPKSEPVHETEVWPGHDYGVAPSSTIGNEKRTNPFILRENFDDFVHLKRNWAEYKRKHGIK